MANENKGITLAQIRSGAKEFVLDNSTVSDDIRAVQVALRVLGYWGSPNNPDGSFGSYSVAATRGYQKENGISVTGRMNKATLTHIEKSTGVLYAGHKTTPSVSYISKGLDYAKLNDTGAAITTITTKLKNLGFLTASKSTFDSTVRTAVGNFQSQYGLSKDYTVGQGTYAALLNPSAANWFSNGKVSLTAGMLARCGFSCTLLLPTFVTKLNAAMNNYGINTKVKARHFLAQVRAETANGYADALSSLDRMNWKVDCILTHCGPSSIVRKIDPSYGSDQLTDFLDMVNQRCQFTYWFFGHYHDNRIIDDRYILQWEQVSGLEH